MQPESRCVGEWSSNPALCPSLTHSSGAPLLAQPPPPLSYYHPALPCPTQIDFALAASRQTFCEPNAKLNSDNPPLTKSLLSAHPSSLRDPSSNGGPSHRVCTKFPAPSSASVSSIVRSLLYDASYYIVHGLAYLLLIKKQRRIKQF